MSNFWFCDIQKSYPPPLTPRKSDKALRTCKFTLEYPAIFCHFFDQKYTSKSMNFFIFGRAFGRVFGILPYTDGFFASIFDSFLPQIADCQGKN